MLWEQQGPILFLKPKGWVVEREEDEEGWRLTLQSPGTAFLLLTGLGDGMDPAEAAEATLDSLQQDYPELESTPVEETMAGLPASGFEVEFAYLDIYHRCKILCVNTQEGVLLSLWQLSDIDADDYEDAINELVQGIRLA